MQSFADVFKKYKLTYIPRSRTTSVSSRYLLSKLKDPKKVPIDLYQYFENNLRNKRKMNLKFKRYDNELVLNESDRILEEPTVQEVNDTVPIQEGQGILNNIKIDENSLNKNILKIRYLNGRKLNNKLLKHDYKISKNMKDAIKFNKNINKLSSNEKNIYYELEKYINKDKPLDVLIGSYLSGDINKKLFNRINKILYNKYKNNLITYNEYTNLLNKINNT